MKLIIDIPINAYLMIKETIFTECTETMFLQTPDDRLKTMLLFKTLDSIKDGKPYEERPQDKCNCSNCDYFKFSQSFIENVVKFMTDYNIETVEDLMKELNHTNELLGGRK